MKNHETHTVLTSSVQPKVVHWSIKPSEYGLHSKEHLIQREMLHLKTFTFAGMINEKLEYLTI